METRRVRLVALTNDALGLAAANFNFPIYQWNTISQSTQSISEVLQNETWRLRIRNIRELMSINPEKIYTTIPERLMGLPKGYSLKIEYARCLFEDQSELHYLDFFRDTIHKSFSTETSYQDYLIQKMEMAWSKCSEYYKDFPDISMQHFRPSILVLESIDDEETLAENWDLLINIYKMLVTEKNPISQQMYEIVWRIERKRGIWEYYPYEGMEKILRGPEHADTR